MKVATGGKNKTLIQNDTIILKLETVINSKYIDYMSYYTRRKQHE